MSNSLQAIVNQGLDIWNDNKKVEEIRKIFAPKLNNQEFDAFIGMGKASGLNPFLREIWAVKYQDSAPAQIFVGRDGYRKAAQRNFEYDYHECDAVYTNDKFKRNSISGEIDHEYNLKDRGDLLGAYCIVKRKNSTRACYTWVKLSEYSTGKSLWASKPETMIKKVAECQGLRGAFQDLLGGTYGEEEMGHNHEQEPKKAKSQVLTDKIMAAKDITLEVDYSEIDTGVCASEEEVHEIEALVAVKGFTPTRFMAALEHYKVEVMTQLTSVQAQDFIGILRKLEDK